jgi:disulfide oxidoreductase YuzD
MAGTSRKGESIDHMSKNTDEALVQIVGAPVACAGGVKETWREVAAWAAGQMDTRFGDQVRVEYYDLFDPGCPSLPPTAQLPLILINGEVLSSGGKIAIPAIRKRLESMGLVPVR